MALEPYDGPRDPRGCVHSRRVGHLPYPREMADLVGDNGWALPVADNLHNNVRWAWQEGLMPDGVNPQFLARWLGHNAGVTLDRAHDLLEPYASRHTQDMHFSHMAREAHKNLIKRSHKTILVTAEAPCAPAPIVEHGSTIPTSSGSLAT